MPTKKKTSTEAATSESSNAEGSSHGMVKRSFDEQLVELERAAARSTDPVLTATLIALSTPEVVDRMRARAQAGYVFGGISSDAEEEMRIVFLPPPGELLLSDPSLTVRVDLSAQRVLTVVEGSPSFRSKHSFVPWSGLTAVDEQTFLDASANAEALRAQFTEVVTVSLNGTFFHGEVAVDSVTIKRFNGTGSATVPLLPPTVDVVLTMGASAAATYDFSITVRGVTKKEPQGVIPGGKSKRTYSYPFDAFGLPLPKSGGIA